MATMEGGRIDLSGRGPSMVATVDVATLGTPTNNGARFDPVELGTWTVGIVPPLTRCADLSLLVVDSAGRLSALLDAHPVSRLARHARRRGGRWAPCLARQEVALTRRGAATSSVRLVRRAVRRALLARPGATRPRLGVVTTAARGPRRAGRRALLRRPDATRPRLGVPTITAPGARLVVPRGPLLVLRASRRIRGGTRTPRRRHTLHALRPFMWRLARSHPGGAPPARFIQRRKGTSGC